MRSIASARNLALHALLTLVLVACSPASPAQPASRTTQAAGAATLPNFVELVKREGRAVVNISSIKTVRRENTPLEGLTEDDPFYEFFRRFMELYGQPEYQTNNLGSGFLISEDGYILTNTHVVADTDEVTVKLTDKREFKAKVIGFDRRTDVALIRIQAKGLPKVELGDPSKLEVGEWVAAIGSPFGFENSVTAGIVSGKGRFLPDEDYVPYIQTDVAVNPGNSGGPLFNLKGEVIGINSQIFSRSGGYMGLSFAIPIDVAVEVSNQLRTQGKVTRGRIGVQMQELTSDLASSFGLESTEGALVSMVEGGSPAAKAGLLPGDVILEFGGKPVQSAADLSHLVGSTAPGTSVAVDVWRKGAATEFKLTVGEQPAEKSAERARPERPAMSGAGLSLGELTDRQKRQLGIQYGVLVQSAQGAAQLAGIYAGDVIMAINDTPVRDVAGFKEQLGRNANRTVALLVRRGELVLYVPLKAEMDD
jgi:serine protease Do